MGDANVPQDYVRPGEENPPRNQHGSKARTTITATRSALATESTASLGGVDT
jgi:hypothetical protein